MTIIHLSCYSKIYEDFIIDFNEAIKKGLNHIPELIFLIPPPIPGYDLEAYFTHYISYDLDRDKKEALNLFMEMLQSKNKSEKNQPLVYT